MPDKDFVMIGSQKKTFTLVVIAISLFACRRGSSQQHSKGEPPPAESPAASTPLELKWDLAGATGLALAESHGGGLAAARINADGTLTKFEPFWKNPTVAVLSNIEPLGEFGHALVLGSPEQGADNVPKTNVFVLKPDGSIYPVLPTNVAVGDSFKVTSKDGAPSVVATPDGFLWMLSGGALWKSDLRTGAMTAVTSSKLQAERFWVTTAGEYFLWAIDQTASLRALQRHKSAGGFEVVVPASDQEFRFDDTVAFGPHLVSGAALYTGQEDQFRHRHLPAPYRGNRGDSVLVGSTWLASHASVEGEENGPYYAFEIGAKVAGGLSGAKNFDREKGLVFDGGSVAELVADASGVATKEAKPIYHLGSSSQEQHYVFGPDHGFKAAWGVLSKSETKITWSTIDPVTGVASEPMPIARTPTSQVDIDPAKIEVFNVDGTLVIVSDSGFRKLFFSQGFGVVNRLKEESRKFDKRGIVNDGTLYFAAGHAILAYTLSSNTIVEITPGIQRLGDVEPVEYDPQCLGMRNILAITIDPKNGLPAVAVSPCADDQGSIYATNLIAWVTFKDTLFAEVESAFVLPVEARIDSDSLWISFDTAGRPMLNSNKMALANGDVVASATRIINVDRNAVEAIKPIGDDDVNTQGFFRIAKAFSSRAHIDHVIPWTATSVLTAGREGGTKYRAYREDFTTRATAAVSALDDVQVHGGGVDSAGVLLVSGQQPSSSKPKTFRFDADGNLLNAVEDNELRILKVLPLATK